MDSYSAFFDNGGFSKTDLENKLIELGVDRVFVSGLALDFCVFYSAMDADHLGTLVYLSQKRSLFSPASGVIVSLL